MFDQLGFKRIYLMHRIYVHSTHIYKTQLFRFSRPNIIDGFQSMIVIVMITVTVKARLLLLLLLSYSSTTSSATAKRNNIKTQVTVPNHRQGVSIPESIKYLNSQTKQFFDLYFTIQNGANSAQAFPYSDSKTFSTYQHSAISQICNNTAKVHTKPK